MRKGAMLNRCFLDHPRALGETYWQHQRTAWRFAAGLAGAAAACAIHGLIPALFPATGSGTVARLHASMAARRPPTAYRLSRNAS